MEENGRYVYLDHTADIKFEAYGKTYDELFLNAGYAFSNLVTDSSLVEKKMVKKFYLSSQDIISLLYDFLEELIILFEVEHFVVSEVSKIEIDRENNKIFVKLTGDEANRDKYEFKNNIKAVTYSDMKIEKIESGLKATVVVDI